MAGPHGRLRLSARGVKSFAIESVQPALSRKRQTNYHDFNTDENKKRKKMKQRGGGG